MSLTRTAVIVSSLLLPAAAHAADPDVDTIVRKTNHAAYYQGRDGRSEVEMRITDAQGRERTRRFTILRLNVGEATQDGDQKFYLYFHAPADVARTTFLVHKHVGGEDDRWLYLPGLDLVKRIAAADERTSFVGSDFFYEDVSGRGLDEDTHTLVETTKRYYVLEHKPKQPKHVEFASCKMWVHRGSWLPTKTEYRDAAGKLIRVMTVDKVKKVQGKATVMQATMVDKRSGSKTVLSYRDPRYDLGLPDRVFTERYLRRKPVKYLGQP